MRHTKPFSILSLALVAILAGCSSNEGEAPIASTTPGDAGAAVKAPVKTGPVALSDIFSSPDSSLHEVRGEALDEISAGMSCSLDSVNGAAPGSAPIARDGALTLSGWYQHKEATGDNVLGVVMGEKAYAFLLATGESRPDVAKIIGATDMISDVSGTAVITDIPAGTYSVYYVRDGASGSAKCVADKQITIN